MLSALLLAALTEPVPLPGRLAGPLHFPSPPSCAWLLVWLLLIAGLAFWLGRLLWRRLRRWLAARPPRPAPAPPPPPAAAGIFATISGILGRHLQAGSYRQGCHELSGALRRHWEERGLVRSAGPPFTRLTAREIADRVGDRPATRLLSLLSTLQFGRREPTRQDLEGACKLAGELLAEQKKQ